MSGRKFQPLFYSTAKRLQALRNRHFLLIDLCVLLVCPAIALALRMDGMAGVVAMGRPLLIYTLVALLVRIALFRRFELYNRYWRDATVDELVHTLMVVSLSTAIIFGIDIAIFKRFAGLDDLPRSLPLIDGLLALVLVGMSRFSARLAGVALQKPHNEDAKRLLIVGAGSIGQHVVRVLQSAPGLNLRPVAFIDDDPVKQGLRISGLAVLGRRSALPQIVHEHQIDEVLIAMPDAPGAVVRDVLALCDEAGVKAKLAPAASDLISTPDRPITLRQVEIEDLLRREPVVTDIAAVRQSLQGQRVLITGGGGSIGSELCRQVLRCEPSAIALLGHGENSVFDITNELDSLKRSLRSASASGGDLSHVQITAIIADIRSRQRMTNVMRSFRPDVIFHAAAHKHVPLMEHNPAEAISNNVFGTRVITEVAAELGITRLVMISSDKAVNPTSIMGASKRVAELLVLRAARETGHQYVAVRFGNVLGSRGSVVPLFRKQIAAGGPVTVSHPDMRRYFMTIPEAVQLVLQASVLGNGGEVFMLDMGDPVRIVDLARDLIELSGLEPDKDIPIVFTGVRPGEKLFEELFVKGEVYEQTCHEKILLARNASSFVPDSLSDWLEQFSTAVAVDDGERIRTILGRLVPEFLGETAVVHAPASTGAPKTDPQPLLAAR